MGSFGAIFFRQKEAGKLRPKSVKEIVKNGTDTQAELFSRASKGHRISWLISGNKLGNPCQSLICKEIGFEHNRRVLAWIFVEYPNKLGWIIIWK